MNKDIKNPLDSAFFAESSANFFVRVAESTSKIAESSAESTPNQGFKNDA